MDLLASRLEGTLVVSLWGFLCAGCFLSLPHMTAELSRVQTERGGEESLVKTCNLECSSVRKQK